jgi:hypothetical protein
MPVLLAGVVLVFPLITAQATAPGPIVGAPIRPNATAPTQVVDDGLGVAGVDVGKAGTSKQSRMTYLNSHLQETQANVWARCGEILDRDPAPTDTVAFCKDVLPRP